MARTKQTARKTAAGKAPAKKAAAKPAPKKAAPAAKKEVTKAKPTPIPAPKGKAPAQKAPGSKPAAKPAPKKAAPAAAKKVATKPAAKTTAAKKAPAKMEKIYSLTEKQIQTIVNKMLTEQMAKLVPAMKTAIVKALVAGASPSDEVEVAIGVEEDVEEETEDVEEEEEADEKQEVKEGVSLLKEASKMSVKELKDFAAENEIELPKKGSGNKGVMVKQDYVDFFADYPVDEEEEKPKKSAPAKKPAAKKDAKTAAKKTAAKKAKSTPKPKTTPLKVAGKKLVVKLNEELGVYTDGDNHVYDEKSHSVYGMLEDDKVRPLKVAEAKALEKKKIALYHVKVLKRDVGKVATKKEVDELVNAGAETEVDEEDEDKDVEEEDDEDIELEEDEDEEVDEEEDKKREKEEIDEDGGVFEIDEEDLEEEEDGEEDGEEESGEAGDDEDVVSETEKNVDETVDEPAEITSAQFAKYVKMQYSGASMSDTPKVVETTGLTEGQVQEILMQYRALATKYPKVVEDAKKAKKTTTPAANQKKRLLTKK